MNSSTTKRRETVRVLALLFLGGCLCWSLWPVLAFMQDRWTVDPRYAHGYLVPAFSLALLWLRRDRLKGVTPNPSTWGLLLILLGAGFQLLGGFLRHDSVAGVALVPYLAGLCLILGGWGVLRWAWLSIVFLLFMVPLPFRVENALGPPLQEMATNSSTYVLQTLGFMAFSEGFVIQLNDARIGVVEACSGLSMLMTFTALATAAALVVDGRSLGERLVLVLSSMPVALAANILRITATAILHDTVGGPLADKFYHDLAGWVMIPVALGLYWLEIWVLSRLVSDGTSEVVPVHDVVGLRRPSPSSETAMTHHRARAR
jgi:exosortase